jgi:DNA-3-methyladenine glycosylase I
MKAVDINTRKRRCSWPGDHPLNISYHDDEWGVVQHTDQRLFEMLTLEGAQAGLSWLTILNKREGYRRLFADFDVKKVADFDENRINILLNDAGIVRHRGKIEATVNNARHILGLWDAGTTLDNIIWESVNGRPITNHWNRLEEIPASTMESVWLSKRLKKLGFRFVGGTTCYALMQAAGLVNDHEVTCFRHRECELITTGE